ncbi:MAG: bifunctional phosphopantothenoylcysteine decarboxylase/phosphopantothenate--cysteine ligase CoaBC, partial [Dehalococcoidia bacterium]|nr:bifunctional phosphopantothenoylcysteine decarboxylase/phosphopantothenate--cysteine ligase CoaBC [Dehalococcoidia bacterium]
MWENPATQENVDRLRRRGFVVVGPGLGWLAEGKVGFGRMAEPAEIIDCIKQVLGRNGDLVGRRIVVTAGGTQEPIDPVRHISNKSSGKMGYAIAEAARDRGAEVTLIAAPTALPDPARISVLHVSTAEEMYDATAKAVSGCDALIMAAAVADYRPARVEPEKIKKSELTLKLDLVRTKDILGSLDGSFVKVGFAAESNALIANARKKLTGKGLDLIVANDIMRKDAGFGSDMNKITMLGRGGKAEDLPLMPKREAADRILDRVASLLGRENV